MLKQFITNLQEEYSFQRERVPGLLYVSVAIVALGALMLLVSQGILAAIIFVAFSLFFWALSAGA